MSPSMVNLMIQYGDATSRYVNSLKGLSATDSQIAKAQELGVKMGRSTAEGHRHRAGNRGLD